MSNTSVSCCSVAARTTTLVKRSGLEATQVAELTRIALSQHQAPVSRIVRVAMAFLKQSSPTLRLIISYADPSHDHHGGIYQAGNWTYVGQSDPSVEYLAPDGKQWHGRMVSASGRTRVYGQTRSVWRHDQCSPVTVAGKHKYLMPLDDEMRCQIAPLAKPYPKRPRAGSIEGDAPTVHVGEDGPLPISALQETAAA